MGYNQIGLQVLLEEAIASKRDGRAVGKKALEAFVRGLVDNTVTDGQAAAFAMAVCINGMDADETSVLTDAMARSGEMIEWDEDALGGPVLDKHSSGGVGDKVSLLLAPIVAACGGYVPMISGRGLGHTGGTLDKLESIPGYDVDPGTDAFRAVVAEVGCAIAGASGNLAPADRRLYAIRDVTHTVDSVPLITASILSKKIASGASRLVMDVKVGNGAFMRDMDAGQKLARSIVDTADKSGLRCVALLTDMDEPLGECAGNALELREVAKVLSCQERGYPRLMEVTFELAAEMLVMGGLAPDIATGRSLAKKSLSSGAAAERLAGMVRAMGGDPAFVEDGGDNLAVAPCVVAARPETAGHVAGIDAHGLGQVVLGLGGGRMRAGDKVDHGVGLAAMAGIGDAVGPGADDRPLALVHARDDPAAASAAAAVAAAYEVAAKPCGGPRPAILGRLP